MGSGPVGRRTNVVLVLADDLGFSDLGCYGGEIDTPHLDRLGRSGVRMSSFYNTARCSPSRASLLTGRHPHETGIGILTDDQRPWGYPGSLDVAVPTAAEIFRDAGYATCLSGKWHLSCDVSTPNPTWPTRRGFDEFYGILPRGGRLLPPAQPVHGRRAAAAACRRLLPDRRHR
ncbi:sulfatase-like hydrolase/transferase [Saccharopolyspora sp. NPDC000359]|uniref:sulfatase-like hydrolase/transferase n=1 Tax=Saccharopolyspora sp. NPDC000359 TaxID=3154251 RepID=UPI003325A097